MTSKRRLSIQMSLSKGVMVSVAYMENNLYVTTQDLGRDICCGQ